MDELYNPAALKSAITLDTGLRRYDEIVFIAFMSI